MKYLKWAIFLLLVLVIAAAGVNYPKLTIISGYAAKNMASSVFIAGRSESAVEANDHQVPLITFATTEEAPDGKRATASVWGLQKRTAVCREGLGCALVPKGEKAAGAGLVPRRIQTTDTLPFPFGRGEANDTLFPEIDYVQLEAAVSRAFEDNTKQRSRTLLIAYKNHILRERYDDGFDKDTPILGWSMTKSVLATLFGILEHQGTLDLQSPAPVSEWSGDARADITLDHLLRMQSGLAWEEDYTAISDVTRMLFLEADMPAVQREKEAIAKPTEVWNYSSGTSNLLSGILRGQFATEQEYLDFPYAELIDKTGMHSMLLETDVAGNFVGSSYGWASTRDWARFGLLYLNEGLWNGERIFGPEWVAYVTRPTAHSDGRYGAHFWLNAGGIYPGVPRDLYSANGYQGQYVFIIPSLDLVIVRTGLAEPPDFELKAFLQAVVKAINPAMATNPGSK